MINLFGGEGKYVDLKFALQIVFMHRQVDAKYKLNNRGYSIKILEDFL